MSSNNRVTCSDCGLLIEPNLVLKHRTLDWNIVRCPKCKLTFVNPQPPNKTISAYYNGMYSKLAKNYNAQKMAWARTSVKGYHTTIQKLEAVTKGSLLDLGGGLGYYAKAFDEIGLFSHSR